MSFRYRDAVKDLGAVSINTDRLVLRPIQKRDTEAIFHHFTAEITRYMMPASAKELSETEAFVTSALLALKQATDLHLVISDKAGGEFLGICGLHDRGADDELELGIWLKIEAHGRRAGFEAISGLKEWAEDNLLYRQLIYPVDRRNIASRKIPEALGGRIIAEKKQISMAGHELDEIVFAIGNPNESGI